MGVKFVGLAIGALVGVVAAVMPLGGLWTDPFLIPLWLAGAIGSSVAGALLAPRLAPGSRQAHGGTAVLFAVLAAIVAIPLIAVDGVAAGLLPRDPDDSAHPGPFLLALIYIVFFPPLIAVIAAFEAVVWTFVVRFVLGSEVFRRWH